MVHAAMSARHALEQLDAGLLAAAAVAPQRETC